jgi:putative transposase
LIAVNPNGTSQTCLCGAKVWKELSERVHTCTACGLIAPRDVVSAQLILQRARISPSSANVSEVMLSVA